MQVTLLGTGDSAGTPVPRCECDTCERARETGVERTRFSVHVHNPDTGESLLIDTSPDLRRQFLARDVALPDAVVITHVHFDHLDGLGNAYRLFPRGPTPVYAADEVDPVTDRSVAATVRDRYDYLETVGVGSQSPFESFETCGLEVELVPVEHPPMLCYGVRVRDPVTGGAFALTGDTAWSIPEQSASALSGVDLLLADGITTADRCDVHPSGGADHDASGTPRTFGTKHMTVEGAIQAGERLDAGRTRVVHVGHFTPVDRAFEEPLAVDGEYYEL
jgi:Metal-dependent hydrolases of the beta-lactamase superfamily I